MTTDKPEATSTVPLRPYMTASLEEIGKRLRNIDQVWFDNMILRHKTQQARDMVILLDELVHRLKKIQAARGIYDYHTTVFRDNPTQDNADCLYAVMKALQHWPTS